MEDELICLRNISYGDADFIVSQFSNDDVNTCLSEAGKTPVEKLETVILHPIIKKKVNSLFVI